MGARLSAWICAVALLLAPLSRAARVEQPAAGEARWRVDGLAGLKEGIPVEQPPVVLWHGMGDSCCDPNSMGKIKKLIESELKVKVISVQLSDTIEKDIEYGYFGNVHEQIDMICDQLKESPYFARFDAIGFSQGGQFIRGLVQRCYEKGPQARRLITLGSQHQGVMEIPGCLEKTQSIYCKEMRRLLDIGAYTDVVRSVSVQAQYFKDPWNLNTYMRKNIFLPDINNEYKLKRGDYARSISHLELFAMYMFMNDTTVVPKESSWFGVFDSAKGAISPIREQTMYQEDWLGLKLLDDKDGLYFGKLPGEHMEISMKWFNETVVHGLLVDPYYNGR